MIYRGKIIFSDIKEKQESRNDAAYRSRMPY